MIDISYVVLLDKYDYNTRKYIKETEYYKYRPDFDNFCACCGAVAIISQDKKKQDVNKVFDYGIAVYFTDVAIPANPEIEVNTIQTKNGLVKVVNAIAWSEYKESEEVEVW